MSNTPETDELARSLLYERLASTETCYYEMRMLARQLERDRDEQRRLLVISTERECDLRRKICRLERELEQVREQYRLSSVCRQLKEENDKLKQQQP